MSRDRARYGAWVPPTPPRAVRQAGPGSFLDRVFISDRPMNQSRAPRVSSGRGPAMFRPPMDDETKLGLDETILGAGEDGRKLALATSPSNEATGPQRPRTGDRHDQGFFRNRCCCVDCRRADRIA